MENKRYLSRTQYIRSKNREKAMTLFVAGMGLIAIAAAIYFNFLLA